MKLFMQKTFQRWLVEKHFQRNMEITMTQWQLLILKDLTVWRLLLDIPYMRTSVSRLNLSTRLFVSTVPNLFSEYEKQLWWEPFQSFVFFLKHAAAIALIWCALSAIQSGRTLQTTPKKLKSATNGPTKSVILTSWEVKHFRLWRSIYKKLLILIFMAHNKLH